MAIALDIVMSVPRQEEESTGKYQRSVSGVPLGCALGNSLDLMLVFPCTPLLSSRYRLNALPCKTKLLMLIFSLLPYGF